MNRIATECACRTALSALNEGVDHLVILTSSVASAAVRRSVGSVMPPGSTSTGAVWRAPGGQCVSVKRYQDTEPEYPGRIRLNICNGGKVLSRAEAEHVKRWRSGGPAPISIVGA